MTPKQFAEKDLLKDLDEWSSHADELAEPLPQELEPLERLQESVKRYDRPTDPVRDEYAGSDGGFIDDFMEDRDQPSPEKG